MHDKIAALCLEHFKKLPKTGKPNSNEWTILSCIVLELDDDLKVVALGTGSKCIGKSKMSSKGDILNDSHAEIICRRSFLRYLYNEMHNKTSLIIKFNNFTNQFSINGNFHFFTTHVPCGDAAIFPKQDSEEFGDIIGEECEETPQKRLKYDDIYRTGAKCLPNSEQQDLQLPKTEYHVTGVVRTKPGRGDPTLSVSCSDKIAKWSYLGIQGALLSLILEEPIYLSSFTVVNNTPFCKDSFNRAMYTRLGNIELEEPFHQKIMQVHQSKFEFEFVKNCNKKPCPSSISWFLSKENNFEVVVQGRKQGATKKNVNSKCAFSNICKYELFKAFNETMKLKRLGNFENMSYKETKMLAKTYHKCWLKVKSAFKVWTCKNEDLLQFNVQY